MAKNKKNIDIRAPAYVFEDNARSGQIETDEPPTVVIFGAPRGGTTMVAGIVRLCGVDLGAELPTNLEDPAFTQNSRDQIKAKIAERNLENRVWGWKFPRASSYLLDVQDGLRNPHYVIVWRDVLATATRSMRRGEPVVQALTNYHRIQRRNINMVSELKGRSLLVSYEKAVAQPVALAQQLCEFLSLPASFDVDAVERFAEPGTYKPQSDTRLT